jgi:hypothetical protein
VSVCGDGTSGVEDEANARLIAAAPEMLDALRDAQGGLALLWWRREYASQSGFGILSTKIGAAIAKASGR